jgi:hypothetical protein
MSGDFKFTPVVPHLVEHCWGDAAPLLSRACEQSHGRYTADAVRSEIDSGRQVLWILYKGDDDMLVAITTSMTDYPGKKMMTIQFCGADGEKPYWLSGRDIIVSSLKDFAKERGCSGIELSGRRGWGKVLSPFGFNKTYSVFELEI